jgi:hypothetical protein
VTRADAFWLAFWAGFAVLDLYARLGPWGDASFSATLRAWTAGAFFRWVVYPALCCLLAWHLWGERR